MWTNRNGREYMYWNNVETQPGLGYPRDCEEMGGGFDADGALRLGRQPSQDDYGMPWDYNYEEALMTGTDPWLRPNVKPTWGANWDEDQGAGDYPNSYYFYLPRLCNHCTNPACLAACPRDAIYKREEDGIVLVDQERCRGYRYCVQRLSVQEDLLQRADLQVARSASSASRASRRGCRRPARSSASGASAGSAIATTKPARSTSW